MIPDTLHLEDKGCIPKGGIVGRQGFLDCQGAKARRLLRLQPGGHVVHPGIVSCGIVVIVRQRDQVRRKVVGIFRRLHRFRLHQIHTGGKIFRETIRLPLFVGRNLQNRRRLRAKCILQGNGFLRERLPLLRRGAVADRAKIQLLISGEGSIFPGDLHIRHLVQIDRDRDLIELLILSVQFKGQ